MDPALPLALPPDEDVETFTEPVRVVAWLRDRRTIECEFPSGRALAALFFGRAAAARMTAFAVQATSHDGRPVLLTFSADERRTCAVDFDRSRPVRRGARFVRG